MIVGMDLARRRDYAAVVTLTHNGTRHRVARAEQIPHTADYGSLATYAAMLADSGHTVILDGTGVGVPVVEDARTRAAEPIWSATIHGGQHPRHPRPYELHLPKRGMIRCLRRRLDTGELVIPDSTPGAALLIRQLAALAPVPRAGQRRPAIEARQGHDDLASAAMMAVWMMT